MNRIGGKSNTGEGGEDPRRYTPDPNGDSRRSAIKQVASGRFGVTAHYLVNADELQIKMAQGAKPGEGGQLPGHKVDTYIAKIRHSTPGVGLISPPPHHDIYSIEDLKQLIFDLRCANPRARISVKLVSEVGVGTVAAGVAKANSDHVVIAGHDGGTGASPVSSIQSAGVPWEIGLAETQQTLVMNKLRDRIVVQTDGQLKTGRDVMIAALLGAEEFGFSTAPLISMGCIMMRACHLNTCPVGIATQDPELRRRFRGQPEHVVNFFFFVAEEVRRHMAGLGVRRFEDLIGRTDLLEAEEAIAHWKARGVDLTHLLTAPDMPPEVPRRRVRPQDPVLHDHFDLDLIPLAEGTLEGGPPTRATLPIRNKHRGAGGLLSSEIARRFGEEGLPEDSISCRVEGSAGQSFGAWLAPGVTLTLYGDANDYTGKGLSGGVLVVRPPERATFRAEENVMIGNTVLYGATSGRAFFRGLAGERFGVRNSGVSAVIEGVGDHGCEYMTGGRVVVLGPTGRNFAAGMSGGVAYVLDEEDLFDERCNKQIVDLEEPSAADLEELRALVEEHRERTDSPVAARVLADWDRLAGAWVKVMPRDYKRALAEMAEREAAGAGVSTHVGLPTGSEVAIEGAGGDGGPRPPARTAAERDVTAMGELGAFLKIHRENGPKRPVGERLHDFEEFQESLPVERLQQQGARCMECGVPFCHQGCPLGNLIPDWNDLVYRDRWREAIDQLHATNNFPEFTGRICPAPCEAACVLDINDDPVTIKSIEVAIADRAFAEGWVKPRPPAVRSGKSVAVIGSGPAGLAAAAELNQFGHAVTLYERNDRIGGLLRYGVPDFKLDKGVVQRRVDLLAEEGVDFRTGVDVGRDITGDELRERFDAVVLATGSTVPRDLPVPGRELDGVHFAMEYLELRNRFVAGEFPGGTPITAAGKHVVIIGGGDTGADCLGNSHREDPASVTQFELLPEPPPERPDARTPWPQWPMILRTSAAHEEGGDRRFSVMTTSFEGEDGRVTRATRPRGGRAAVVRQGRGLRVLDPGRPGAARDGLRRAGAGGPRRAARGGPGPARQRGDRRLRELGPGRLRVRRRPPRAVADRLGDRRGAPGRARGGSPPPRPGRRRPRGRGPRGGAGRGLTFSS